MKIYLSHAIRGKYGVKATFTQMEQNCQEAIKVANYIRENICPPIEIYVPAESEDFVGIAYKDGYLNEREILEIDCKIIDTCDVVLFYVPEGDGLQGGRLVEYEHAVKANKPVCVFYIAEQAVSYLSSYLLGI